MDKKAQKTNGLSAIDYILKDMSPPLYLVCRTAILSTKSDGVSSAVEEKKEKQEAFVLYTVPVCGLALLSSQSGRSQAGWLPYIREKVRAAFRLIMAPREDEFIVSAGAPSRASHEVPLAARA